MGDEGSMSMLNSPFLFPLMMQQLSNYNIYTLLMLFVFYKLFSSKCQEYIDTFNFSNILFNFRTFKGSIKMQGESVQVHKNHISTRYNFPISIKSILWYLQNEVRKKNITVNMLEEFVLDKESRFNRDRDDYDDDYEYNWVPPNRHHIDLNNGIYCSVFKTSYTRGDNPMCKFSSLTLVLYSYKYNYNQINNFLRDVMSNYINEDSSFTKNDDNIYLLRHNNDVSIDENPVIRYKKKIFSSVKRFDNLFFKEKEDLINDLDFFNNNKKWYIDKGIPYTFGLLLYGKPGTGKSSLIKAISNYTHRHILDINLKTIKTIEDFEQIFNETKFSKHTIHSSQLIIILEDIDCLDSVATRRNTKKNKLSELPKDTVVVINKDSDSDNDSKQTKLDKIRCKKSNELTLSHILNVIDGTYERDGSILIITSNHPEKLDPALIRPGRIDWSLNLDYITKDISIEMFKHFYANNNNSNSNDNSNDNKYDISTINFPHKKITPAYLQMLLKHNKQDVNKFIEIINATITQQEVIDSLHDLNNFDDVQIDVKCGTLQKIYFDFICQNNSYNIKYIIKALRVLENP
jgi:hypothetical protein